MVSHPGHAGNAARRYNFLKSQMPTGTLETITKVINSPPGVLVAGGALFGIVYKFFEKIEGVLNENSKLEIAVWLLGVKVAPALQTWPETFRRAFDRVLGSDEPRHFWRFCIVAYCLAIGNV